MGSGVCAVATVAVDGGPLSAAVAVASAAWFGDGELVCVGAAGRVGDGAVAATVAVAAVVGAPTVGVGEAEEAQATLAISVNTINA